MKENDSDVRMAELQMEKETLSQQVKRLIKAEGKLYQYQEELDAQLKEYKDLYELNKELNATFDIEKIFAYAVDYATRNLEYERAVLFERVADTAGYHACVVDGYYDAQEKSSVGALVIEQDDPFLSPLFAGKEYLLCKADTEEKELVWYRAKLRMNEYFMCRLGAPSSPIAFLAFGNSAENAQFYRKVDDSHGALLSIGNFVGLISSSIEKHVYSRKMEMALEQEKRAGEALKESEERYRTVVETAQDAIITIDEQSRIVFANPSAERIFGYPKTEMAGHQLTMLIPERFRNAHLTSIKRHVETGKRNMPWEAIEFPGLHKSGREVPLEISYGEFVREGKYFFTGIARDITERKRAEETIKYQVYHDLLTGLPNRALFTDLLNHEIPQMQRTGKRLAVLFLDIDHFKNINDALGHAAGDALIQQAAVRLRDSMHEFDTVARIGGDKFTILLPLIAHPGDAAKSAEEAMEVFKKPFRIDNHEFHITVSVGISLYPDDGENAEILLKNADIAMYHAKRQGRNNYQFFNAALNIRTIESIILENRLRQALKRGELVVYYQPQIDIRTLKIIGAEALVRWNHPELGLLNPEQFIPLAEEIGVITHIDQWVMHTACLQLKKWQKAGYPLRFVAVNLSARQFQQPNLAERVSAVLTETDLSSASLGIEITETLAMQDTDLTARNLDKLSGLGVRFSIDDFGTGYSSLSYLKKLPIHKLKIDKSFILHLVTDPDYQAIINAVIAMAHILKLTVVAEGVETEDQMSFLHSKDCDEIQGYLYSKPVPAEALEKLLVVRS